MEKRDVAPVGKKWEEDARKEREVFEKCVDIIFVDWVAPPGTQSHCVIIDRLRIKVLYMRRSSAYRSDLTLSTSFRSVISLT